MAGENLGFWTGGPEALLAGLKKEHQATVAQLEKRLKEAESEEDRRQIADELGQVEKTYKERLGRVDENIF